MTDVTVIRCIAYGVAISKTTYRVPLDESLVLSQACLGQKLVKSPITNSARACINGAISIYVQQVLCVIAGPVDDTR